MAKKMKTVQANSRSDRRLTFKDILNSTRVLAAQNAWSRAILASRLRHMVVATERRSSARILAAVKRRAIMCAIQIVPDMIQIAIDDDFHVGCYSIRWPGRGALHLPPNTIIRRPLSRPAA